LDDPGLPPCAKRAQAKSVFPARTEKPTKIAEQKNDRDRHDEIGRCLIALVQTGV
jgi:hypothetical protein